MAAGFYQLWKQAILIGTGASELNTGAGASVIFAEAGYVRNLTTHDFFADLSNTHGDGGTARANSEVLASPTYTLGTFDAADTVFASVNTAGVNVTQMIIFVNDSSADATSYLVANYDTATGIPFSTSSGAQVTIAWHASGIFAL